MKIAVEIIYEDRDLLVANKPSGISVIPERIHSARTNLQAVLQQQYGRLFVVHRIDRGTSGIVCFARNENAHKNISLQFQNHTTGKFYKAIVRGRMKQKSGIIDASIMENSSRPGTMLVNKKGKEAITIYEVEEEFKHASLLNVEIKTGRTHQVRVHLASIGNPLLVDEVYGNSKAFYFSEIKKNYKNSGEEECPTIARLTLHAYKLILIHPVLQTEMRLEAAMPEDMQIVLKLLKKYDA